MRDRPLDDRTKRHPLFYRPAWPSATSFGRPGWAGHVRSSAFRRSSSRLKVELRTATSVSRQNGKEPDRKLSKVGDIDVDRQTGQPRRVILNQSPSEGTLGVASPTIGRTSKP